MADLQVVRKTTNNYTLSVTENGEAKNITGCTFFFTVKRNVNQADAQAVISKTITSHTDVSAGQTQISLSSTDTDISPGTYVYDMVYKDISGNRISVEPGRFLVISNVTIRNS